jgi:hypothetical protein
MEELRVTAIRSCFCAAGMWMNVGVEGQDRARLVSHDTLMRRYVGCVTYTATELELGAKLAVRERGEREKKRFGSGSIGASSLTYSAWKFGLGTKEIH